MSFGNIAKPLYQRYLCASDLDIRQQAARDLVICWVFALFSQKHKPSPADSNPGVFQYKHKASAGGEVSV